MICAQPLIKHSFHFLLRWFLLLSALGFSSTAFSTSLHIAAASNFILPAKQLAKDFEAETGESLLFSFSSSGKLFAQIQNNAPYDVFLSADLSKPQTLIKKKKVLNDHLIIYAKGKLALWSAKPIQGPDLKSLLQNAKRIAIANPRLAPYGVAAEESLRRLSIWEEIQNRLVRGESVGQAFQFTYSQGAEFGLVALSQALSKPDLGHFIEIPKTFYNDIQQAGVILSSTKKPVLATQFMAFLMRADTQAKIAQFGYHHQTH